MLSKIWKQYALDHGLHFANSRMYGWLNNFHITLSRRMGSTRLHIYMPVGEADQEQTPQEEKRGLPGSIRAKAMRVMAETLRGYSLERTNEFSDEHSIGIELKDTARDKNRLENFLEDVLSQIAGFGINTEKVCRRCHRPLKGDEVPVQIRRDVYPMHESCANAVIQDASRDKYPKGSLLRGIFGAAAAAAGGAVLWAVMRNLGFYSSIAGIILGFLVSMGCRLLGSRRSRATIVSALLFVPLSVALGQIAAISYPCVLIYQEIEAGLTPAREATVSLLQYLRDCWTTGFLKNAEFMHRTLRDFGVGVLFVWLSCIGIFWNTCRETAQDKPRKLTSSI